jgi:hypothetical protein
LSETAVIGLLIVAFVLMLAMAAIAFVGLSRTWRETGGKVLGYKKGQAHPLGVLG